MNKTALITGITGQDGAYLAELLLEKGYEVHGIRRRTSVPNTGRIEHLCQDPHAGGRRLILHYGDMTDDNNLLRIVGDLKPDEIYNLAAQSHVETSFKALECSANTNSVGALRLLEAIRILGLANKTRFFQASSSELFGKVKTIPQSEKTPFNPRSPYAAEKLYAHLMTAHYREAHGIHASNGILFNHESPLRGVEHLSRKVSRGVAATLLGLQPTLYLGNLSAEHDWGHARDYVKAMWLMLQKEKPDDYVVATGKTHSVRQLVECAFAAVGITLAWEGYGLREKGRDVRTGRILVAVDPSLLGPAEVELHIGDASKASHELGWEATTSFRDMIYEMVQSDAERLRREQAMRRQGQTLSPLAYSITPAH
jgi:GDPmannose 4,6-dehydratase